MIFSLLHKINTAENKLHSIKLLWPAFAGIILWVLAGSLFYYFIENCTTQDIDFSACPDEQPSKTCGWGFHQSFYYSVQAGLSIGFGLLAEDKDISRLYSVFHILAGSSFIAGALALFVSVSIMRNSSFQTQQEQKLARFSARLGTNGYKGLGPEQMCELMIQYPQYLRDLYMVMESDNEKVAASMKRFDAAGPNAKRLQVYEAIQEGHQKVPEFQDGAVTIDEIRELHNRHRSLRRRVWVYMRKEANSMTLYCAFIAWVSVGICFGVFVEKWSFIQSLYFSIAALSTAGLQAVTPCNSGANVTFTGFYALIGVPVYGMTLGSFANLLVDQYNKSTFEVKTRKRITSFEVEFVEHLLGRDHSDSIDLSEYLQIQLLRLGKVDRSDLEGIKNSFEALDVGRSGRVQKAAFMPPKSQLERMGEINKMAGYTAAPVANTVAGAAEELPAEVTL